jgi:hypothetical protein
MHQMHLPQIRRIGILPGEVEMLDPLAHMGVAFDAQAGQQADAEARRLAEVMAATEADGDYSGHANSLKCRTGVCHSGAGAAPAASEPGIPRCSKHLGIPGLRSSRLRRLKPIPE